MRKFIYNNAIELFQTQFGWSWKEVNDNSISFIDYEDQEYIIDIECRNVGWKPDGTFKYNTLLFDYEINPDAYYYVSFNYKGNRAFVCKREDLVKKENIIYKNTMDKETGKQIYNKPYYEIHLSMCELYIKKEDGWYYEEN